MARRTSGRSAGEPKRRGEPVVRKVLEVTLEQLAANGYERLSVPEIAALAGLNKTSVYRRWPTKADLVREALQVSMGHAGEVPDTGDLRSDLLEMARAAVAFVESPLGMGVLRMLLAEGASGDVREFATSMFRQQETEGPRAIFKRAIARGELPEDADVKTLLSTVAGALMHRVVIERARVTEAMLEKLIDLVLYGILTPRPKANRP